MGVLCGVVVRSPAFTHMFGDPPCILCRKSIVRKLRAVTGLFALTGGHGAAHHCCGEADALTVGRFARYATALARRMQRFMMSHVLV